MVVPRKHMAQTPSALAINGGGKLFGYNQAITGKVPGERKLFVNEAWLSKSSVNVISSALRDKNR